MYPFVRMSDCLYPMYFVRMSFQRSRMKIP